MDGLKFRQIHLDFHNSELLQNIGSRFEKEQFQQALIKGHVNSITLFSKCHHGYSYHPTEVNEIHPGLDFDLLAAQIEACKEIGVATRIYISAGLDEKEAKRHPEWLTRKRDESINWAPSFDTPGYHLLCYNTGYLDLLADQVDEVMERYHPDGLFLDISAVRLCYCAKCRDELRRTGKNVDDEQDVLELGEKVYARYAERMQSVIDKYGSCMMFHNAGHISRGRHDLINFNTHIEAESLPTGGWGYDHFPLTAAYLKTLDKEYLGMTGKFHTTWGEFGGFKHPNALMYEAALSIAMGAKCSIGDQLHPLGMMDMTTYELIGKAYADVEAKEEYCDNITAVFDIAVLSDEAVNESNASAGKASSSDVGANRILSESNYLYCFIDQTEDFNKYKLIILPDSIRLDAALSDKLNAYLKSGGKLLASGVSGLYKNKDEFALPFNMRYLGISEYAPSYIKPIIPLKTNNNASFVMYSSCHLVTPAGGNEEAYIENPYFNRKASSFSSHQHTPNNPQRQGTAAATGDNYAYIAYNIFEEYARFGSLHLKELVGAILNKLLGNQKTLTTSLPDKAIVTLNEQKDKSRLVLHMLYAHTTVRGRNTEVIEDIVPLYNVKAQLQTTAELKDAILVPQNETIPLKKLSNNRYEVTIPQVYIHQMVVLNK